MIYLSLFLSFFYIGLFTIGGGYAMIPLVNEVVVQRNAWISAEQFEYMIGLSECTPGPIALNMATFVGAQTDFLGGLCATLGVVLPSFIIICIVAALFEKVSENIYVKSSLKGASFVAIGLIASIAITMFASSITNINFQNVDYSNIQFDFQGIKVLAISGTLYAIYWIIRKKKPSPIPTILASALVGLLVGILWK